MKNFFCVVTASILALLFTPGLAWAQKSAETYYVSAAGNDDNDGLSEASAFRTLSRAVIQAGFSGSIKTVTVIGTLDETSETLSALFKSKKNTVFACSGIGGGAAEITITGKQDVRGAERAILSARGAQAGVIYVGGSIQLRFEHIEISGGENKNGRRLGQGISMDEESRVTLGPGVVVRGNQGRGIRIYGGSCIVDGGDIRDNAEGGVYLGMESSLTLLNGSIANNRTPFNGGGVGVNTGGVFTMSGGSITGNSAGNTDDYVGGGVTVAREGVFAMSGGSISGNSAPTGGGVAVLKGGVFNQTGGTIGGNHAPDSPNIWRWQ